MMRPQRARDGGSRVEMQIAKWTAEGAVKGEETLPRCGSLQAMMTMMMSRQDDRCGAGNAEYSATKGMRQLPGICWYSAESMGHTMN